MLRGKAAAELAQQALDAAGGLQRFAAVVIPHLQAAFPFIARGWDLFDHALLGQLIDPVGGAGLGNAHLPGKLGEGGALQQVDDIGGDGIGSGEPTGAVQQPPVDGQTHPVIEGQKVFGRFHG